MVPVFGLTNVIRSNTASRQNGNAVMTTATTPTYVAALASIVFATNRDRASTSAISQLGYTLHNE